MTLISQTDSTSEIFVQLRNGPHRGKNPKFHFIVEWRDTVGRRQTQEYWTLLYDHGWVDEENMVWLKDTLTIIEPYDTVYTDLNFPAADLAFPDRVTPEQITAFWIQATMRTP